MKRIIVSGYFNPLHTGHIDLIEAARALGDYVIVIVNNDKQQLLKKGKIIMNESSRMRVVGALRDVDEVILSVDQDPPIADTLGLIAHKYPQDELVFGNGGDRHDGDKPIPQSELDAQEKYGIKVAFGLGGNEKADSSTRINQATGDEEGDS